MSDAPTTWTDLVEALVRIPPGVRAEWGDSDIEAVVDALLISDPGFRLGLTRVLRGLRDDGRRRMQR